MGGCDKSSPDSKVLKVEKEPGAPAGAAPKPLFDQEIANRPCELLTAEMAAEVLGVGADSLESSTPAKGWCTWRSSTAGEATISFIKTQPNLEQAASSFDGAYRGMSPQEVAEAMQKIEEKVKPADAKPAKALGGAIGGVLSGGFTYEDVPGVGDAARLALMSRTVMGNVYYDNKVHVRVRNMDFTLSLELHKVEPPRLFREELTTLAKRVVAPL